MRFTHLVIAIGALLGPASGAVAREIIVAAGGGGEFTQISQAVAASEDGDVIIVYPGEYGAIHLNDRRLTVRSTAPEDPQIVAQTIVTSNSGPHLTIRDGADCTVAGFTFEGRANYRSTHVFRATGHFSNNVWFGNRSTSFAGAVYAYDSTVTIERCAFYNNESFDDYGSAIRVTEGSVSLRNNYFEGNVSILPPHLQGNRFTAWIEDAHAEIIGNTIIGEGVYVEPLDADLIIVSSNLICLSGGLRAIEPQDPASYLIMNNQISGEGTGAGVAAGSPTQLVGNTFGGGLSSGMGLNHEGVYDVRSNVCAENHFGIYILGVSTPVTAEFNCLGNNNDWDVYVYASPPWTPPNNLYGDPLQAARGVWDFGGRGTNDDTYVDGDPHLTHASHCIDAADPAVVWPPDARDTDGQVRVANGRADIGADEYPCRGDLDGDGRLSFFDVDAFVLALLDPAAHAAAYPLADATLAGDVNHDDSFDFLDIDPFVACLLGDCPG